MAGCFQLYEKNTSSVFLYTHTFLLEHFVDYLRKEIKVITGDSPTFPTLNSGNPFI